MRWSGEKYFGLKWGPVTYFTVMTGPQKCHVHAATYVYFADK